MDFKSPNIDTLRQMYAQSPIAKAFFDHGIHLEAHTAQHLSSLVHQLLCLC